MPLVTGAGAPGALEPDAPELRSSGPAAVLRAWLAGLRRGRRLTARRQRGLDISRRRLLLASLAGATLAAAGASLLSIWQQRIWAHQSAIATLQAIEQRLDAVALEMHHLGNPATLGGCGSTQTAQLIRASLRSHLVRSFAQQERGADYLCSAEGPAAAGPWFGPATNRMELRSTGQIAHRLLAARTFSAQDAAGTNMEWVVSAELDERVFEDSLSGRHEAAVASHVVVRDRDGWMLASLARGLAAARLNSEPRLQSALSLLERAPSQRYPLSVEVQPVPAALLRQVLGHALVAALLFQLLLGLATFGFWTLAVRRARLVNRIALALRQRQFEPHVQPIVDLATGQCVGGEVLMRWHHPQRGILSPFEFIDEAERTGLIVGMSDLVMVRAAHRLKELARLHPGMYFSFNITAQQLREPAFAQRLNDIFNENSLPREQVLLELTEREAVDKGTRQVLDRLHGMGWRVAIDDFGTGQSSLASLERMKIDRIKIDRAFVRTIDEHTLKRPVLDAIIALAGQLGVRLIAEGVETQAQWNYLRDRGVQYAQGYLFAKPMEITAFSRWLCQQPQARLHAMDAPAAAAVPLAASATQVPLVDAAIHQLNQRLRTTGGLDVRTRMYGLRTYAQCFVGNELVDWLVANQRVSRLQAVALGQRMLALGLIRHVVNEHDFKDELLFYRFVGDEGQSVAHTLAEGLTEALRSPGGPRWRSHCKGLIRHGQCLTGHELIGWVAQRFAVSRATATQWATQLMQVGVLRHVYDDQPLRDGRDLYRLMPPQR